ncbi:MAG: ATP-binding protein [Clostridiales bacterium]|jgi:predicted AAA+ superfamily ATPase|nr:ATP-binding protein [Clostridiales bacterium]
MFRKITAQLEEWRESPYRKPLILQGARQVGKTYIVLEFARNHYDNIVSVNFEREQDAKAIFEASIDPEEVIPRLAQNKKQSITKGRTLLFLDEIQACPSALTSLKYFNENANDYHVIAAGSLLGVAVAHDQYSFPVGKVNTKTLCPMDFEEFLIALGKGDLALKIRERFEDNAPMESWLHKELLGHYRSYLIIGGMPSCVNLFKDTRDYTLIRDAQNAILTDYLNDMSKYNTENEIKKTRLTYSAVSAQLSKKNTRFQYKLVKKGGRASEFENAIEWLALSGIVSRVYNVDAIKKPLEDYKNIDSFKIFFSDIGLLNANKNIIPEDILYESPDLNDFKGGMTENYVCQQLVTGRKILYTWHSEGIAEIDFIYQDAQGKLILVEVKSADNTQAKSLTAYVKKHKPAYAIKLSTKNFGFVNGIKTVPLYAAFCI